MASASKEDQVSATPSVDAAVTRALLSSGSGGHAYIDVRLPEDFDKEHAAGASNVPYYLAVTPQGQHSSILSIPLPRSAKEFAISWFKYCFP
jgi:rhodanese-related sulfurtransferase